MKTCWQNSVSVWWYLDSFGKDGGSNGESAKDEERGEPQTPLIISQPSNTQHFTKTLRYNPHTHTHLHTHSHTHTHTLRTHALHNVFSKHIIHKLHHTVAYITHTKEATLALDTSLQEAKTAWWHRFVREWGTVPISFIRTLHFKWRLVVWSD